MKFLIILISITYLLNGHAQELPPYCEYYPTISKKDLNQTDPQTVIYQDCINGNLPIDLNVEQLLSNYSKIQEKAITPQLENFNERLRAKLFQGLLNSSIPYLKMFDEQCRSNISRSAASRARSKQRCQEKLQFPKSCQDTKLNNILNETKEKYSQRSKNEAQEFRNIISPQLTLSDEEVSNVLQDEKEKLYLKNTIQRSVEAKILIDQKDALKEQFERTMNPLKQTKKSCFETGNWSASLRFLNDPVCLEINEKIQDLEKEYQQELQGITTSLSIIYNENPTVFDFGNEIIGLDLFNSKLELSELATKINKKVQNQEISLQTPEQLEIATQKLFYDRSARNLALSEVQEEMKRINDTLGDLCKDKDLKLHNYNGIAQEVLNEMAQESENSLVLGQAAYCHLLETKPIENGLSTWSMIGATALVVGGTLVQIVPGLGQVAGGGLYGLAATTLLSSAALYTGGSMFVYDGVQNLRAQSKNYKTTQALNSAYASWASVEDVTNARDELGASGLVLAADFTPGLASRLLATRSLGRFAREHRLLDKFKANRNPSSSTSTQSSFPLIRRVDEQDSIFVSPASYGRFDCDNCEDLVTLHRTDSSLNHIKRHVHDDEQISALTKLIDDLPEEATQEQREQIISLLLEQNFPLRKTPFNAITSKKDLEDIYQKVKRRKGINVDPEDIRTVEYIADTNGLPLRNSNGSIITKYNKQWEEFLENPNYQKKTYKTESFRVTTEQNGEKAEYILSICAQVFCPDAKSELSGNDFGGLITLFPQCGPNVWKLPRIDHAQKFMEGQKKWKHVAPQRLRCK